MDKNNNLQQDSAEIEVTVNETIHLGEHEILPGTVIYVRESGLTLVVRLKTGEIIYAPRCAIIRCTTYDG